MEIEAFLLNASRTEITRNTAISTRMISISFLSEHFFILGLMRSMVSVELEVSTNDDRVDMDADSTFFIYGKSENYNVLFYRYLS